MDVDLMAGLGVADQALVRGRAPRVGVFDSGLGGLTVHAEVARQMPGADLVYIADDAGFPYGPLGDDALIGRVTAVLGHMIERHGLDLVVIACNTASTLALPVLRARHAIPFVGTVPAIKTAASVSASRRIAVLATPGTVARDYTRELIATHAADCRVTLVGSPVLAGYAEAELRGEAPEDAAIAEAIAPCFAADEGGRVDTVVLACTHYPLLLPRFEALAPWPVTWIDSAAAIARRAVTLVGAIEAGHEVRAPRAVFTAGRPCPPVLGKALMARGFVETVIDPLPMMPRTSAC